MLKELLDLYRNELSDVPLKDILMRAFKDGIIKQKELSDAGKRFEDLLNQDAGFVTLCIEARTLWEVTFETGNGNSSCSKVVIAYDLNCAFSVADEYRTDIWCKTTGAGRLY